MRVIVGLGEADISSDRVVRAFCDVGRAADVRFEMPGNAASGAANWIAGILEDIGVAGIAEAATASDPATDPAGDT